MSLLLQMKPDSGTSPANIDMDSSLRLLHALNDQRQAAIDECVVAEGAKDWINNAVEPRQLFNPVSDFEDVKSITCLTFASLVNDARTVRQLVESGADVRATDWTGCTPLHYACASRVEAQAKVEYMLQRDASLVNATNYSKSGVLNSRRYWTPLHVAARHNRTDCVKTLISDGKAPVNATDQWGRTALHLAAEAVSADAVKVLVQHPDCCVNVTDERGRTALHLAAEAGSAETLKVLAWHSNCDFNITDDNHHTAAERARYLGLRDIAALIVAKSKGNFNDHLLTCFC